MASKLGDKVMWGSGQHPVPHAFTPSAKSIGLCEPYGWLDLQQSLQSMRPPTERVAATHQQYRWGHGNS